MRLHTDMTPDLLNSLAPFLGQLTGPNAPAQTTASGNYETIIGVIPVDSGLVDDALPDGLTLVPDETVPEGTSPVLITLGKQSGVKVLGLNGVLDYHEAIIAVPNIQVDGFEDDGLATYTTRIEIDDLFADLLGKAIGLPKEMCYITESPRAYSISGLLSRDPILGASPTVLAGGNKPGDYPNFDYVMRLMQQPVVSLDPVGTFLFIQFNWDFADATLKQTHVDLSVEVDRPALPAGDYEIPGFLSTPLGSGLLGIRWKLTGPFFGWP